MRETSLADRADAEFASLVANEEARDVAWLRAGIMPPTIDATAALLLGPRVCGRRILMQRRLTRLRRIEHALALRTDTWVGAGVGGGVARA